MGKVDYMTGIAILQFIVFPFILAASVFIWKRSGFRVGAKIWRYPFMLSLLRLAGSIATFIKVDHDSMNVEITIAVCELIGIAPLILTYVGILRQIDYQKKMPNRPVNLLAVIGLVALILAITGVVNADFTTSYTPGTLNKAAMGIFIAVFAATMVLTVWLYSMTSYSMLRYQKMLFLAIAISMPFTTVRLAYSAIADYDTSNDNFKLGHNNTIYLCMSVLEEIVACFVVLGFGILAVLQPDFVKIDPHSMKNDKDQEDPEEGKPLSAGNYNTAYHGANTAYNPAYDGAQQSAPYNPAYDPAHGSSNVGYYAPPHNA